MSYARPLQTLQSWDREVRPEDLPVFRIEAKLLGANTAKDITSRMVRIRPLPPVTAVQLHAECRIILKVDYPPASHDRESEFHAELDFDIDLHPTNNVTRIEWIVLWLPPHQQWTCATRGIMTIHVESAGTKEVFDEVQTSDGARATLKLTRNEGLTRSELRVSERGYVGTLPAPGFEARSLMPFAKGMKWLDEKGVFLSLTAVSQGLYHKVTGVYFEDFVRAIASSDDSKKLRLIRRDKTMPMVGVPLDLAVRFCEELTNQHRAEGLPLGWLYRLPTMTEWQDAVVTDDPQATVWSYKKIGQAGLMAEPQPVASGRSARNGFYHLRGNHWEWLFDPNHTHSWRNRSPALGGSWSQDDERACYRLQPSMQLSQRCSSRVGFRVVLAPVCKPRWHAWTLNS